ncbi:MAG: hypothetical protein Fur0041_00180 [Bacteroidia bacterium]
MLFLLVCNTSGKTQQHLINFSGYLRLNDSIQLPVRFELERINTSRIIYIHNAEEVITVNEVTETDDSLNWKMPVFDSEFRCVKIIEKAGLHLAGKWINHSRTTKNIIAFEAFEVRSNIPNTGNDINFPNASFFTSNWETTFSPGTPDSSKAIGVFRKGPNQGNIYGTFLTETGDYRYLEGYYSLKDESFNLYCFDGSHAFYFRARKNRNGSYTGDFWSGSHWHEKWNAVHNPGYQLRDPEKLTTLNPSAAVDFTFYDTKGNKVSLHDERFKNKVVIVQIMGSWCPNCMDESLWLSDVYRKYNKEGLEVIGLSYEKSTDTSKSNASVNRMTARLNIPYTVLNTGKTGKNQASESLPFLNGIMAFPTTIYIDKKGVVRKIYTGYNGPATGKAYDAQNDAALRLILQLLHE